MVPAVSSTPLRSSVVSTPSSGNVLRNMQTLRSPAAVVITCSPETIACAKISGLGLDVFVIFDPHPRPSYPSGAGLILSTSIDQAVARLASIFPVVDEHFLSESDSEPILVCYGFISNGPGDVRHLRRSAIESGLVVLKLKAEIAGLKQENALLEGDVERLGGALRAQSATDGPSRLALLLHGSQSPQDHRTPSSPSALSDGDLIMNREAGSSGTAVILELNSLQQPFEYRSPDRAAVSLTSHNFSCAICMDERPVDDRVELDCNHPICRKCTRSHVCAKIGEHRFPVLCPVCMTEPNDRPGGMYTLYALIVQ